MNPHPPKRRPAIHEDAEQSRAYFDAAVEALLRGGHGFYNVNASIGGGLGGFCAKKETSAIFNRKL